MRDIKMHRIVVNVETGEQQIVPLTPEEIEKIKNTPIPKPTLEEQKRNRMNAYMQESDPLFFKVQRGEATLEEWNQKIEEIRQRFPYPNP
jgi:hypothetical protein